MDPGSSGFWLALLQIIVIDLLLSGDNAVVIALACRNLPEKQRRLGVLYGVAGAVLLRVLLTLFAVQLLQHAWLKLGGGLLLLWIGIKLLLPEKAGAHEITAAGSLAAAVRTIVIADAVMSLDNVIGVAGAARGSVFLLVFGLLISIPLIIGSSHLILHLMQRYPLIISLGAALLGYVGADMMMQDSALAEYWPQGQVPGWSWLIGLAGAGLVVVVGRWWSRHQHGRGRALS